MTDQRQDLAERMRVAADRDARGRAMHHAVTGVDEAWDEIGPESREDWRATAERYEGLAAALRSGPEDRTEREPDAWIHENAARAIRTGAGETLVSRGPVPRGVPVYFGTAPDDQPQEPGEDDDDKH